MQDFVNQFYFIIEQSKQGAHWALLLLAVLWGVQIINALLGYRLNILGIHPRRAWGLPGIVFSPFLHGGFEHLFLNSVPLFILSDLLFIEGVHLFIAVSLVVMFLSGLAVWLLGRPAIHIGASGLIMGYWGFLLIQAYQQPTVLTIIIAVLCLYYFGGLVMNVFPRDRGTSWEGHVFGLLAGIAAAYLLPWL